MGFFGNIKEKYRKEKEQRDYYNSPDSVRTRLSIQRAKQKERMMIAKERSQLLKDEQELKRLEGEGKFSTKAKEYLASVKARRNPPQPTGKIRGSPRQLNTQLTDNRNSPFMPSGRNVMYDNEVSRGGVPKNNMDMFALGKSKASEISSTPRGVFGNNKKRRR